MAKEILVKKHFNQYNPGEIATFNDDVGADIIARGLGTEVQRDRKGAVTNDPVMDAATKPVGSAAPVVTQTTADTAPVASTGQ